MRDAAAELDHVVVNALRDMETAAVMFAALGFALTPLGRHSLGSINHLMMTPSAYLELVGVPAEGRQRQEVLDSPLGLSGLVFKSADADATFARLEAAGLRPSEPLSFSRPVELDDGVHEARFRTVKVPGELFPAGRVYFCEHLTPELVWRPEWLAHPNGFESIDRMTIASADPEADAMIYAVAAGAEVERRPDALRVALPGFAIDFVEGDAPRFVSLDLAFNGLDEISSRARRTEGVAWSDAGPGGAARLQVPSLALELSCRSIR
ncbi:MAG: VOC family protein [Hansschlegelia sp.]